MGKLGSCSDSFHPSNVASSNEVLIKFQSDESATRAGFKMEYNPIGKQITSIQNNTEYYGGYHTELNWSIYPLEDTSIQNNTCGV